MPYFHSLVFHSLDKVTSLFIHIYPPFTFTVILHYFPGNEERYPGIVHMKDIGKWRSMALGVGFCGCCTPAELEGSGTDAPSRSIARRRLAGHVLAICHHWPAGKNCRRSASNIVRTVRPSCSLALLPFLTLSFSLLHDKHNVIGRWMRATKPEKRESLFMFWQLGAFSLACRLLRLIFI